MHRSTSTPWTKSASSFPSDRIKPVVKGSSTNNKSKGKGKDSHSGPAAVKSREVHNLEGLLESVRSSSGHEKDPKDGCYCLARVHDLSSYTPICRSCGLILCSVNQPQYCCPDCLKPLLTERPRNSLIAQFEAELASTIAREIEDKERAEEEKRRAVGAFPALPSSSTPLSANQPTFPIPSKQTHKVMSLTGSNNNKRVVVSSYTTKYTPASRPLSTAEPVVDEPKRVPPPAAPPVSSKQPNPDRPFENFIHGSVTYRPPPPQPVQENDSPSSRSRGKRRGRGRNTKQ